MSLYSFSSFTFDNAGTTGINGPTLTTVRTAYKKRGATWADTYLNMTTQGIQKWTVPVSGIYKITAAGASGGGNVGAGSGACIEGMFFLTKESVINILVGQMGGKETYDVGGGIYSGGGGGGTFVVQGETPIIVAGGGGGRSRVTAQNASYNETDTFTGTVKNAGSSSEAYGGAGYTENSGSSIAHSVGTIAYSYINGGVGGGGSPSGGSGFGGFGGGGGDGYADGGGGGGYSGGNSGTEYDSAGGGGSFFNTSIGSSRVNKDVNVGHGFVVITNIPAFSMQVDAGTAMITTSKKDVPGFPTDFMQTNSSWFVSSNFYASSLGQDNWKPIVGSAYTTVTQTGFWGIWLSKPDDYIHWRNWATPQFNGNTDLRVKEKDIWYEVIVKYDPSNKKELKFALRKLYDNTSIARQTVTETADFSITGVLGNVTSGGWELASQSMEIFHGKIERVSIGSIPTHTTLSTLLQGIYPTLEVPHTFTFNTTRIGENIMTNIDKSTATLTSSTSSNISISKVSTDKWTVNISAIGTYTLTYTFVDPNDFFPTIITSASVEVTKVAPTITFNNFSQTYSPGGTFSIPAATSNSGGTFSYSVLYRYFEGTDATNFVSNWNNATIFTMSEFGGLGPATAHGYSTGPVNFTLTLPGLGTSSKIRYSVKWHLVDSLDNEVSRMYIGNGSTETEVLTFTKPNNAIPNVSFAASQLTATWSGHKTYSYRPWATSTSIETINGYLDIDSGWVEHTSSTLTVKHLMGADENQTNEAMYLTHVEVAVLTNVISISGTTVTILKAGTALITASQAAYGDYLEATKTATITINKATPTITFNNFSRTYAPGGTFSIPAATSNSGGTFSYSVTSGTEVISISGTTVTILKAGTATILASQSDYGDYLEANKTAIVTINKATPVITFNDFSLTYAPGGTYIISIPSSTSPYGTFSYSVTGGTDVISIYETTINILSAGTAFITASQAAYGDYLAATKTATITINKATPTITFNDFSRTYAPGGTFSIPAATSDSDGTFSYSVTSETGVISISGTTVTILSAGTATIRAFLSSSTNYENGEKNITVTIDRAIDTLTTSQSIFYKKFINGAIILFNVISSNAGIVSRIHESNNTSVVSIPSSSSPSATIVGPGKTTIKVTQPQTTNYQEVTNNNLITIVVIGKDRNYENENMAAIDLSSTNLENSIFSNCILTGANLFGAIINSNTNLSSSTLTSVKSGRITGNTTKLPSGFKII